MRLNLNEIMRIEKSAFEYSEFGVLESVEIGDKLYFPASECARRIPLLHVEEMLLKQTAQRCVTNQIVQLNVLTFYLLLIDDMRK